MKSDLEVTYVVVTCFSSYSWRIKDGNIYNSVVYVKLHFIIVTSELTHISSRGDPGAQAKVVSVGNVLVLSTSGCRFIISLVSFSVQGKERMTLYFTFS